MTQSQITKDKILHLYDKYEYPLQPTNIFGIRANDNVSNTFNDIVGILYKDNNQWQCEAFPATTDPGLYYRENPCNVKGTAILKEGFHKDAFKIGYHKGKYLALVQNSPLPLYRDNNRDNVLDKDGNATPQMAGINIHHASFTGTSTLVDKWSAGCQVIASIEDWCDFMDIIKKSGEIYGDVFSYALFNEKDL